MHIVSLLDHDYGCPTLWQFHLIFFLIFFFILYFRARPAVETKTSWNAPIIWEGMFDPDVYDQYHIRLQSSVALTVFAVGRFVSP